MFFDIIGVIAFSISGYLYGTKYKLDILGVFIISFVTAFFGGFIRDMSVSQTPFIYENYYPYLIVLSVVIFSYIFKIHEKNIENNLFYIIADSIGLISFSISGAIVGIENNLSFPAVVFLSLLTATGGGVVRDILLNKRVSLLSVIIFVLLRIYIKKKDLNLPKI